MAWSIDIEGQRDSVRSQLMAYEDPANQSRFDSVLAFMIGEISSMPLEINYIHVITIGTGPENGYGTFVSINSDCCNPPSGREANRLG